MTPSSPGCEYLRVPLTGDRLMNRLLRDHYFSKGYYTAGNEPSFETGWLYHYANRPDLSALRVRQIVYENFGTGIGGVRTGFFLSSHTSTAEDFS